MSERTTIGGTVYESIGSSSSNLLLKCNGTARIQWGNKLIDLIKNGKIASGDSSTQISVISDIADIKSDGVYVLNTEKSVQLWICKNGEQYNLTGTDLYISASTKQDITAEQSKQALENIGMYYNTLAEVQNAGLTNGLVYVLEDSTLYTIKDGVIAEFEAKLKTVTVEQDEQQGEVINSAIKIVLSVLDDAYIELESDRILIHKSVHVQPHVQIGSEGADAYHGYRLFFNGDVTQLDVDRINVRLGIPKQDYVELTYEELLTKYKQSQLEPHQWYLISDFQNHWKIPANLIKNNRPLLVRALTSSTFYTEGQLFKDQRVAIHYDINYRENFKLSADSETSYTTKGRITWMKDSQGNEANFDFLDYTSHEDVSFCTLHNSIEDLSLDASIFPKGSYNNKLTVYDLKGITIRDNVLTSDNVNTVDFQFGDTAEGEEAITTTNIMEMHDNVIECRGIVLTPTCEKFYHNNLKEICNVKIDTKEFYYNTLANTYSTTNSSTIPSFIELTDNTILKEINFTHFLKNVSWTGCVNSEINNTLIQNTFKDITNTKINGIISSSIFESVTGCTIDSQITKVQFKNLTNCVLSSGSLENIICRSDITNYTINQTNHPVLYDVSKAKDIYFSNGVLSITSGIENAFVRGMIVMHSGVTAIPSGWAVCDGGEYEFNGVVTQTPNLINKFIKAVGTSAEVQAVNNSDLNESNDFQLKESHLPSHSHPHKAHTHTFTGSGSDTISQTINVVTSATEKQAIVTMEGGTSGHSGDDVSSSDVTITDSVNITVSGNTSSESSEENTKTWTNQTFKIEPNYYALIFIMKL